MLSELTKTTDRSSKDSTASCSARGNRPRTIGAMRGVAMREADLVVTVARKLDFQLAYGSPAVFGDARPVLNAPKSMLGHTCWAAPLVETIAGILQMQRSMLHPTS